jgi:hypothetical protein
MKVLLAAFMPLKQEISVRHTSGSALPDQPFRLQGRRPLRE